MNTSNNDFFCVVMFPYPSGSGLHLGHYYNYAIMDSYCNWQRYNGKNVIQPFGYDSFGLPAENYAKQVGGDPKEITMYNIDNFRKEMVHMNTAYDEKLITSKPSYYKWTQWIFTELYKRGLAYKKKGIVNWDPIDETVLANEQVKDGYAERSGAKVEHREMEQWYFKITDYKERLIDNLDTLDYPKSTIEQQRHWLDNLHDWCVSRQRSWGTPIPIDGETDTLDTFVDSSFYYHRYLCDSDEYLTTPDISKPVDLYVGGAEHACAHLIYARFVNMFLYDIGVVAHEEPFKKVIHQGMITKDGKKMSKSKGNAVSPSEYNSDVLRFYLMFIGHYFDGGEWSDANIKGIIRFRNRFKDWMLKSWDNSIVDKVKIDPEIEDFQEQINNYVEDFKFNKVVSEFMIFYNKHKNKVLTEVDASVLIDTLCCFMPNIELFIKGQCE